MLRQRFLAWLGGVLVSPWAKPTQPKRKRRALVTWAQFRVPGISPQVPTLPPKPADPLVPLRGGDSG